MQIGIIIFLSIMSLIFLFMICKGLITGNAITRSDVFVRDTHPLYYWTTIAIQILVAIYFICTTIRIIKTIMV